MTTIQERANLLRVGHKSTAQLLYSCKKKFPLLCSQDIPLSDTDFRFSFHKLCFSCSFLLILNNEKIGKKFWAMAAHQKLNSLISVFLITLINPLKKNNLGAKVSVTQDWRLHPPSAVPGRRERKFITQHRCQ